MKLMALFFCLAVVGARAEITDWSTREARQVFKTGRAPTLNELDGRWLQVAYTTSKGGNRNPEGWVYYLDNGVRHKVQTVGVFVTAGEPSTFSFSQTLYEENSSWVYQKLRPRKVSLGKTGANYVIVQHRETRNEVTCGEVVECRMIDQTGHLLCESNLVSHYCAKENPFWYSEYQKL